MGTQSWLNRMNRHYIVSNDIHEYIYIPTIQYGTNIMYKAVS